MEGKGVFHWADGSRYEGGFKDNQRDGEGTLIKDGVTSAKKYNLGVEVK
jgi:hypothetical protein